MVLMEMGEGRGEELGVMEMGSSCSLLSTVVRTAFRFL